MSGDSVRVGNGHMALQTPVPRADRGAGSDGERDTVEELRNTKKTREGKIKG